MRARPPPAKAIDYLKALTVTAREKLRPNSAVMAPMNL